MELYPGVKISIGPPIEDGFYYDFEFPDGVTVSEADFPAIEARCASTSKAAEPFVREDVPVARGARALPRRAPGLQGRADRRPRSQTEPGVRHDRSRCTPTARSPTSAAGRTRRAPRDQGVQAAVGGRRLLARGLDAHDADPHLRHRVLLQGGAARSTWSASSRRGRATTASSARELGLFRFSEVSPGAAFWLPGGHAACSTRSSRCAREMGAERGYSEVKTPQLYDCELWKTSGHWDKYRDNMFMTEVEDRADGAQADELPRPLPALLDAAPLLPRPARCATPSPACCTATSLSGVLHGLLRVRHFAQDDAHIFCTEEQVQDEVARVPGDSAFATYAAVRLRRAPGALDAPRAAHRRRRAVGPRRGCSCRRRSSARACAYDVNPGDGAFYGPKIDMHMTDSLGRSWQLGTVQLDYSMPERFGLTYTGADNAEHRPGDDPPRAVRLLRALHRHPDRALRRRAAAVARAGAGDRAAGLRPLQRLRARGAERLRGRRACASRSTTAPSRWGARSARPSCARCPYMLIVGERELEDGSGLRARASPGKSGSMAVESSSSA